MGLTGYESRMRQRNLAHRIFAGEVSDKIYKETEELIEKLSNSDKELRVSVLGRIENKIHILGYSVPQDTHYNYIMDIESGEIEEKSHKYPYHFFKFTKSWKKNNKNLEEYNLAHHTICNAQNKFIEALISPIECYQQSLSELEKLFDKSLEIVDTGSTEKYLEERSLRDLKIEAAYLEADALINLQGSENYGYIGDSESGYSTNNSLFRATPVRYLEKRLKAVS